MKKIDFGPIVAITAVALFVAMSVRIVDTPVQAEIPCSLDKSQMCLQRKECTMCDHCKDTNDQCCCLHVDRCTCAPTRVGKGCCDD